MLCACLPAPPAPAPPCAVLSDIAAQVTGSVGLGASTNIGDKIAMFEAIHGSAPDIAGKDIANPSGLLLAAVQMLLHIDHKKTAAKVRSTMKRGGGLCLDGRRDPHRRPLMQVYNAWLSTIEDGIHTTDIYRPAAAGGESLVKVRGPGDGDTPCGGTRDPQYPSPPPCLSRHRSAARTWPRQSSSASAACRA